MKDIPIWARWNGQAVLAIHRGEAGYHTYYLRKQAPIRSFVLPLQAFAALRSVVLRPFRRWAAARRASAPST